MSEAQQLQPAPTDDVAMSAGLSDAVRTILGAQPAYNPRAGIVEDGAGR